MTDHAAEGRLHRSSHEDLIHAVKPPRQAGPSGGRIDAIIVPASRPDRNLITAVDLAKAAGCHLVVLCSKDALPARVRRLFAGRGLARGVALDVPPGYEYPALRLQTTEWVHGRGKMICGDRESDLSLKRNLGLLIARMLRWRRIFFLDDDIRGITLADLTRTAATLGAGGGRYISSGMRVEYVQGDEDGTESFRFAGMRVKHFPDNSVVCHARRQVGEFQDVFVSGSVLAVDCTGPFDFFPDIYNEDWFFFYRSVADGRMASPGVQTTQMKQVRYNPFTDPLRAAREEFGDVIAEGLYSLLHHRDFGDHSPTSAYWKRFLHDRENVIDGISEKIGKAPAELRDQIGNAIGAARATLREITPEMCVDYIATWQRDLVQWEKLLSGLEPAASVEEAVRALGLT
jgi:hypothetical protein